MTLLIGNDNTEIPDDIIEVSLNLMKACSEPSSSVYIGYFTPAEITFASGNPHIQHKQPVPLDAYSIHIHPLQNHWVTSCHDPSTQIISVYDSQMSPVHFQQVLQQIEIVYGTKQRKDIKYKTVTQQSSEPICGVMAIAFAFSCFLKQNPAVINYDIKKHVSI